MTNDSKYEDRPGIEIFPQGKLFRISYSGTNGKFRILSINSNDFESMVSTFSDVNPSAFFKSQYGYEDNPRISPINTFGFFPVGLIFEILKYIKLRFGSLSVVAISSECRNYINDHLRPLRKYIEGIDRDSFQVSNIADRTMNIDLPPEKRLVMRDYQTEMIKSLIFNVGGRGLIESPTASGKSLIVANFIDTVETRIKAGLKYLIYVPNRQLVDQFYKDLISYGYEKTRITRLTSGLKRSEAYNPEAQVIISNRQYLFTNKESLPKIDALIADEVHQTVAKSTRKFVEELDCDIKIGCSGTLPRSKIGKWTLMGMFGPVAYVEEITHLQKEGYISKLGITLLKVKDLSVESDRECLFNVNSTKKFDSDNPEDVTFNEAYISETNYVVKNYERLYSPILGELEKMKGNTLVLFDRIEFGQNMFKMCSEMSRKPVKYIDGSTKISDRENDRAELESTTDNILFGQVSILSTGINVRNLTNLVLMVSTKSFSRILQSIGRTLRLHKDKDVANLYDISFNFKYSQRHLRERMEIYKSMYKKLPDSVKEFAV